MQTKPASNKNSKLKKYLPDAITLRRLKVWCSLGVLKVKCSSVVKGWVGMKQGERNEDYNN
jgi:hypothetical protein